MSGGRERTGTFVDGYMAVKMETVRAGTENPELARAQQALHAEILGLGCTLVDADHCVGVYTLAYNVAGDYTAARATVERYFQLRSFGVDHDTASATVLPAPQADATFAVSSDSAQAAADSTIIVTPQVDDPDEALTTLAVSRG